jgi:hypothetical protein
MKISKKILPLALCGALTFAPKLIADSWYLNFFPEIPVNRSAIGDLDISKTELNLPQGLEKEIWNKPIKEFIPYLSLSKELPLLSLDITNSKIPEFIPEEKISDAKIRSSERKIFLSDKIFSASLIANGGLKFPKDQTPEYSAKAELFLNSPMIDDYLSDGNKLLFSTGVNCKGGLRLSGIEEKTIYQLPKAFSLDYYNFFGDIYVVGKSPYSDQFAILKIGLDVPQKNFKETNFNFSETFEFPSLISWIEEFKNSKILPYFSTGIKKPFNSSQTKEFAELGIKITGDSKKCIITYVRGDLEKDKNGTYSTGLRLDF